MKKAEDAILKAEIQVNDSMRILVCYMRDTQLISHIHVRSLLKSQ